MITFTDEQRSDSNTAINAKLWATCQAEAKRKFKIHPSAFSNGYASNIYKKRGGTWRSDSLKEWFNEDWKAINSSGKIVGGCGDGETNGKVKCLPASKARSLSKKDRSTLAKRKQKQDPEPNREGAPVMVSSKKREDTMSPEVFARAILSIEQNYGLRLDARSVWLRMDDWKRLGRDQMGQKCGRGWQGLRGACKRVPKGGDKEAAIKASKVALADRIRKKKGLRDRNAPNAVASKPQVKGKTALNLARGDYGREGYLTTEVHAGWTNGYLARLSPNKDKALDRSFVSVSDKRTTREGNGEKHYKLNSLDNGIYEAETVFRSGQKKRHYLKVQDGKITSEFNDLDEAEAHEYPGLKKDRQNIQSVEKQKVSADYGELTGSEKQISWASGLREKGSKEVLQELSSFPDSPEKTKAINSVNDFVKSKSSSRDWIDNRSQLGYWIKNGASEKASRSDSSETLRHTRTINRQN